MYMCFLFVSESLMYRTIACSHQKTPSERITIIRKKLTALKANEVLPEDEIAYMIDIHKDNQSTNDPNSLPGIQDNDKNEQFFETYSLNETELKEAVGKSLDFTLTTLNQLKNNSSYFSKKHIHNAFLLECYVTI